MKVGFDRNIGGDFLPDGTFQIDSPLGYWVQDGDIMTELFAWSRRMSDLSSKIGDMPVYVTYSSFDGKVVVAKDFITDFNSVKFRLLWVFFSPWETKRPPIPHDGIYRMLNWLFANGHITREEYARWRKMADLLFLESMVYAEPAISNWKRYGAYYTVRSFGRFTWMARRAPKPIKTLKHGLGRKPK